MNGIAPEELTAQFERIRRSFGDVIEAAEKKHKLPRFALYAVGSRETDFADRYQYGVGADGHGHGWWQIDDRSHSIPSPFSVGVQAEDAATILAENFNAFPADPHAAFAAYNAGVQGARNGIAANGNPDRYTTGGNYGHDVMTRHRYLVHHFGAK